MTEVPETIGVKLLHSAARFPMRATEQASGFDLYARLDAPIEVTGQPVAVSTGVALETPAGLDVQIRPRSGLARRGILCTYGTIDADYRGELVVTLYAVTPGITHTIEDGDRIAQLVVGRLADVALEPTLELSDTTRGSGGHGSTGR